MPLNQHYAIKDEKFEVNELHGYTLVIEIGIGTLHLSVLHLGEKRLLATEEYGVGRSPSTQDILETLDELFGEHVFLSAGFWKDVFVCINNLKYTLVPEAYYQVGEEAALLAPTASANTDLDSIFSYLHSKQQFRTVYMVRKQLVDWFEQRYQQAEVRFVHYTDLLLSALLHEDESKASKQICLVVGLQKFSLFVVQGGKLQYFNSFIYTQEPDFIYFVLLVVRMLGLDREQDEFILYGDVLEDSPLVNKLKIYLAHVKFGERPSWLRCSYHFDELKDQQFLKFGGMQTCLPHH